jgi:hypothetical protein
MPTSRKELRNEFFSCFGYEVNHSWSADRIRKEIIRLQAGLVAEQQAKEEAAAESGRKAERRAERDARIAARGSLEDFAATAWKTVEGRSEDEANMAHLARRSLNALAQAETELARFAESFAKDPAYALSWGMSAYKAAAAKKVYSEALLAVETGATFAEWTAYSTKEVLRRARSPGRSTSATSNLSDECLTEAWAEVLDRML